MFRLEKYTSSDSIPVSAQGVAEKSVDITPISGYIPVGCVQINTNNGYCSISKNYIYSNGKLSITFANVRSSTATISNLEYWILYLKSN